MTAKKKAAPKKMPITEERLIELMSDIVGKAMAEAQKSTEHVYELMTEHHREHQDRFASHRKDIMGLSASVGVLEAAFENVSRAGLHNQQDEIHGPHLMDLPEGLTKRDLDPFRERMTAAPPELVRADDEIVDERGTLFSEALARLRDNTARVSAVSINAELLADRLYGPQPEGEPGLGGATAGPDASCYQLINGLEIQSYQISRLEEQVNRLLSIA